MRWDRSHQSNDVDDRRASGGSGLGGGGLPLGALVAVGSRFGWKGILLAVVLIGGMGLCGGTQLCSTGTSRGVATTPSSSASEDELKSFIGFVLDDVQDTWERKMPKYERARLVMFRGQVDTACGGASAAVGPFYCPIDHLVYIDLGFYELLRSRLDAPGDFAQAYVIAHEIGHHIQNQQKLLGRGEVHQIETELQADCLAGAWARDAASRDILEVGDIDEALNAAAQIGDDTLQRKSGGKVRPEEWTHGSAEQRSRAFKSGYQGGPEPCMR